jgi:hypothetical protein
LGLVAGCPASCIFPLRPGCGSGLPRTRSLSAEPASESSGCPLAPVLRLCRRFPFELPRISCRLRRCWFRWGSELPRWLPPPPATPVMLNLGCPSSRISGFTGDGLSSCPDFRILRRCRAASPRVAPSPGRFGIADDSLPGLPRTSNPPAPIDGYPSYLGSRTIRFALVRSPSYPGHLPLATAIDQFPGCPKSWVSHRSPILRLSSRPENWFLG